MSSLITDQLKLKQILAEAIGISKVEEIIASKFSSDASRLTEISDYLFQLGGKKIRPALTIITARAFGADQPPMDTFKIAAGIELIHMATLLHDDIIDKSPLRRHQVSAYKKYGIGDTLLAGDFLLTRAFGLCGQLDQAIVSATEEACAHLIEGEILEIPLDQQKHEIASALQIASKKTASLFQLATFCGGFTAGANLKTLSHLKEFGENLGVAFQILDDILDVTSTEAVLGKPPGTDIRERKPSAINILWTETKSLLSQKVFDSNFEITNDYIEKSLAEINSSNLVTVARQLALVYTEKSQKSLALAKETHQGAMQNNAILALNSLVDYTVNRLK